MYCYFFVASKGSLGVRTQGTTVAESQVGSSSTRKRVAECTVPLRSTKFGEGEEKLDRRRARRGCEPLDARIKGANRGVSDRNADF